MANVKWIKICTDVFDDEKILLIESMPEADSIIVVWFKLLCLAGKQNNGGAFTINDRIAYTDAMLATIFRRKESTVQMALEIFQQFGMVEVIDGVITIPNWSKHQSLDALDRKREYQKEWARNRRAEQKALKGKAEQSDEDIDSRFDGRFDVDRLEEEVDIDKSKNKSKSKNIGNLNNKSSDISIDSTKGESVQKSSPEKRKKGVFQEFAGEDRALLEALRDFNEMRNKKNRKMTDNAKRQLCGKLVSMFGENHDAMIAALNESVYRAWDSVYDHSTKTDASAGNAGNAQVFNAGEIERKAIGNLQGFLDELRRDD